MSNLWKNKLKAAYGKAARARGKPNPDSGAAADDNSDEKGYQFFVAYSPPPGIRGGGAGRNVAEVKRRGGVNSLPRPTDRGEVGGRGADRPTDRPEGTDRPTDRRDRPEGPTGGTDRPTGGTSGPTGPEVECDEAGEDPAAQLP
jgi:hypothetical protein